MGDHGFTDFHKSCNIRTIDIVVLGAVFFGSTADGGKDVLHDLLQLLIDLAGSPLELLAVLGHLKAGNRYAAGVGCFARGMKNAAVLEDCIRFQGGGHVRPFADKLDPIYHKVLCILSVDLILCGTGECIISLDVPQRVAFLTSIVRNVGCFLVLCCIFGDSSTTHILERFDVGQFLLIDAARVDQDSGGVTEGEYLGFHLQQFLDGELCYVAASAHQTTLALQAHALGFKDCRSEIYQAVAGCLGTDERAPVGRPFPCNDFYNSLDSEAISFIEEYHGLVIVGTYQNSGEKIYFYTTKENVDEIILFDKTNGAYVYSLDGTSPGSNFENYRSTIVEEMKNNSNQARMSSVSQMIVALSLSGLIFFFLVRSSLTRRIKELSIYRALGIHKHEIITTFTIEYLITSLLTSVVGVLIGTIIIKTASGSFLGTLFTIRVTLFSFLISVFGIIITNIVIALIPVVFLLKKKPANLLTHFDI